MQIRLTFILLIIVAILGGWYMNQHKPTDYSLTQLIKKEGTPDYSGRNISTMIYDVNGQPQYFAKATEIKRYEATQHTEFINPFINLYDTQTRAKQWNISAEQAEITHEKMLHLVGNVKLKALENNAQLQKIVTDKLTIDLNTQDVFTDSKVTSIGARFSSSGIGLKGNLKQQVATLIKDVKTHIEPTVIQQSK
ncbi:LPS export ABC transporter periplasmic protein LptC [[Haemophilus] ducreyi]|uniref:LPS export ABC transporter periplasmic protein LptC n=1 Tax=Haemophilus ducreyi TaxID=730 RepID=UPI0006553711|nr:LPS export ABC transporter periplasmic protein LptC [[Haemophilus] ducreyi]AKO45079.1 hypothetical protein RZ66_02030 [[Haemophilus] ducreyi]AKO46481.1 hypothetical protein RZ67_02005 [[Haemophilus] ducreyi]AKO47823.1 hypothetical protein RZ68_02005 [[Haemophilus] ducreyi]AKO49210.1 hypothetical protein RZ69_02035 [[Haemophilus] ducreyi]ANF62260.1 LPS export ABC transporter periplasmic protein LptC [[Haemophilus] ducreyi]